MRARGWVGGFLLTVCILLAAGLAVHRRGYGGIPLATTLFALFLLILPFFLFGLTDLPDRLAQDLREHPPRRWGLMALFLVPYAVYGLGTATFSWTTLLTVIGFVLLPTTLVDFGRRVGDRPNGWDGAAILALWLPLDLRWLDHLWEWPERMGAYGINAVLAVDVAVCLFVCIRGWKGVGYRFNVRRSDLTVIPENFFAIAALVIPLGLLIGFLELNVRRIDVLDLTGTFVAIFLFVALPEELVFRGLIQNSLEKVWGRNLRTLLLAALLFGAAHLNNPPSPNVRYFLLASIAGIFYGRAYTQSGGLMAPAAVHALVDTVWGALFR